MLKSGGKSLAIFLGLVILLIVLQNLLAIGTSHLLGIDALIGMCTGSIPMVGGHGTAGRVWPGSGGSECRKVQRRSVPRRQIFGLIAGSLVGGPLGETIEKKNLLDTVVPEDDIFWWKMKRNMSVIRICMHLQCFS